MKKIICIIYFLLLSFSVAFSQEKTLKENALEQFKKEHYKEAIELLEIALKESPEDAEIYYYLGWFNHYRAFDSRPLSGYNYTYSEQIFKYLDKALELNPDYGDAKYFYGAECSANAFLAMQNYDSEKLKYFYKLANEKGAYPVWLKEFGKNILLNCDKDAIFFAGGNADFDICFYLQLCENYRTDITIIPIGNIDRPWYIEFLKNVLKNVVRSIKINLSDLQIMDIHPFKWDSTEVGIDISSEDRIKYQLSPDYILRWTVFPDLMSERLHSKIEGENAKKISYLSPQRAMLLQILEDNFSSRPIYFSNFASPTFYGGLEDYFQNCGLVSKLMPIKTEESKYAFDKSKIETLIMGENFDNYITLNENDFPRISGIVIYGYSSAFINLADIYRNSEKKDKLKSLIERYELKLKINFKPEYEKLVLEEIKK